MSDIHIGAFRQPELRGLVLAAFEAALDRCVEEKVDFVILAGDIFDSNVPDLGTVSRAASKMKEAADKGLRFYAIYGSHDFSPNYSSIVDVLDGAGLFRRAEEKESGGGKVTLRFVEDPTGARICGISGKKLSIDREEYAMLDRQALEKETGFKVFVFHGGLDEMKPKSLEMMETMPASSLPAGFGYYAGGHIHGRDLRSLPGRPNVAFPGPLFATDFTELLPLAHGEQRGFYLVDFDEGGVSQAQFVPVKVCDVIEVYCSAEGRPSTEVVRELMQTAEKADVGGKVVLLTVEGRLSRGKTSDVNLQAVRKRLYASDPLIVLANQSRLTSTEQVVAPTVPRGQRVVERELFERGIAGVKSEVAALRGEKGVSLAVGLLETLKEARKENENKAEFEDRITAAGLAAMGLEEK
jgi:hypothetical protein